MNSPVAIPHLWCVHNESFTIVLMCAHCRMIVSFVLGLVFCVEPWLCRAARTPRKLEGQLPLRGHDGARPSDHHKGEAGQLWLH